ncbi:MAG: S-adenosyl-l-methionine hydroxide adenosyltransferase family protein [candidate division KSB1 bacterium]|nr:S-adenosyl-l-methionine hydroxide adenosyltransferase family protein [candidate division KSB1 bacterium]MDZ7364723.1 S-adenosyl-l-methionine hydroxide adenosyltransferase family protein [candidate division KSB1 bacterium]MDZ7402529.1 S-adenosyl-l-methionine hydroxide adenosyltransferase family protein [candidate division KSB1 bacterium]
MQKSFYLFFLFFFFLLYGCSSAPPTVALLTDYGAQDHYVAQLQGVILSINPKVRLVHITHEVPTYDIRQGSFMLATAAGDFPRGTIFVAVVDPDVGSKRKAIIVETLDQKYFVGPDNGLFTDVIRTLGVKRAFEITNLLWYRTSAISSTFHGRDVFAPAAAHLSKGKKVEEAGPPIADLQKFQRTEAVLSGGTIRGEILHCDRYGNLITNIHATVLAKAGWKNGMTFDFKIRSQIARAKFSDRYNAVAPGEYVVLLNSHGLLEIARNLANAASPLGAASGDTVEVLTSGKTATN